MSRITLICVKLPITSAYDARVDRPEIMELYELMTPQQQSNLINYARGMLAASAPEEASAASKRRA